MQRRRLASNVPGDQSRLRCYHWRRRCWARAVDTILLRLFRKVRPSLRRRQRRHPTPTPTPHADANSRAHGIYGGDRRRRLRTCAGHERRSFTARALDAQGNPVAATFSWHSSDDAIATAVDGTITAVALGQVQITVTANGVVSDARSASSILSDR